MQPVATQYDASKQSRASSVSTSGWSASEVNQFRMNSADPPYVNGEYIDNFLRTYYPDSPLIGEGNTIKELADYYGIAVGSAMGIWAKETTFGRAHPGLVDHNYGCIRHTSEWSPVWYGGSAWNKYPNKRTGIAAWFKLVRWFYVETGQGQYGAFLDKYSPSFENNQATFKNIMWGVLKAFGYSMSATVVKTNNSKVTDDPRNITVTKTNAKTPLVAKPKQVGGSLTESGRSGAKSLPTSNVGDSLGLGTRPYLNELLDTVNHDVVGSRQITHATDSLNATKAIQNMISAGTLKDFVVFIIGTNRGVTKSEIDNVVNLIGSRKLILVTTASQVSHNVSVRNEYLDASKRHSNVFVADWYTTAQQNMSTYYTVENGKYIHMTALGYRKHAEFIAQALHEANTVKFTSSVSASRSSEERITLENVELTVDGKLTYKDDKGTHVVETGIKGFYSPLGDTAIYNPEANQMWGYGSSVNSSNWIEAVLDLPDETDQGAMMLAGLKELQERSVPAIQYRINLIDIDPNISIGDTGIFVDHEFQPPLYIQARILSITTSDTNLDLNLVVIGNVIELVPESKDFIHAIQAGLKATREDLRREQIEGSPITVEVTSNHGLVLGDAFEETTLEIKVYRGTEEITSQFSKFEWERVSDDEVSDQLFNQNLPNENNTLLVKSKDIEHNKAKFIGRVYNDAEELIKQSGIDLKRVETALWVDTPTPPDIAKDGATWTKPDGTQWVKKDGVWQERVDQETISAVRLEVEDALSEAQQAKSDASTKAQTAYDNAVAEADRLAALRDDGITIDASQITAGTIDVARLDAVTIRAKVLETDVVKSTHIEASSAIINKLFAQSAYIEALTSKTAFIENIKAIEITADKITGTNAEFITASLKSANSNLTLDGSGMVVQDNAGNLASISSLPEIRTMGIGGSSMYLTQGELKSYSDSAHRFSLGTKLKGAQHGILIAKSNPFSIMQESDSFGGIPAKYHKVAANNLVVGSQATIKATAVYLWDDYGNRLTMNSAVKGITHTVDAVGSAGTWAAGKYKLRHPNSAWGITGWVNKEDIVESVQTWRQITTIYYSSSEPITTVTRLNGYLDGQQPYLILGDDILVKEAVAGNDSGIQNIFTVNANGTVTFNVPVNFTAGHT